MSPLSRSTRVVPWSRLFLFVGTVVGASAPLVAAVNTIVTTAEDEVVNGNCTLREAILATISGANVDQCAGDVGPDTIVVAVPGPFELDDGELPELANGRDLTVRGDATLPRSGLVVELGGSQRFARVANGATLRVEHLELEGGYGVPGPSNEGGGAILATGGEVVLRDVRIAGSSAGNGGAIDSVGSGRLDFEGVRFENNRAEAGGLFLRFGGALRIVSFGDVPIRLVDSVFDGNAIVDATSGHIGNGGALSLLSGIGGNVELRRVRFLRNRIDVDGAGAGGAFYLECEGTGARLELSDLEFDDNQFTSPTPSDAGAALYVDVEGFPQAWLRRVAARGNGLDGATVAQIAANVAFPTDLVLSDLLVVDGGGIGVRVFTNQSGAAVTLGNVTVSGQPGNGIELSESVGSSIRLENSIAWGNGLVDGKDIFLFGTPVDVAAENLVGIDPLFVDPANGDYRLAASSPAADAGDAGFASVGPFDLAHGPRVAGTALDLGAFERGALFADDFEVGDAGSWNWPPE